MMRKNILLIALLLALAACHTHRDHTIYRIPFNPPAGSTYHYELTSETTLTVKGGDKDVDLHRRSNMAVNYQVSKDSNEIILEMTFDKLHIYTKNGDAVTDVDAARVPGASDPASRLLAAMKTTSVFARVRLSDFTVAFSGGMEVVGPFVERNYAETDKAQAREYWQQWIEQGIIWKNLDPLTRIFPDPAQHVGDRWKKTSTNRVDINFKIDKRFQLESVDSGIATIRSEGRVSNDNAGTWLLGDRVRGDLTGKEDGVCFIDIATGMPVAMEVSVNVGGNLEMGDRQTRIEYGMTTKMKGHKVN